jgi:hypothetical protein
MGAVPGRPQGCKISKYLTKDDRRNVSQLNHMLKGKNECIFEIFDRERY